MDNGSFGLPPRRNRAARRAAMSDLVAQRSVDALYAALGPELDEFAHDRLQGLFLKNGPYRRDWSAKDRAEWAMHMDNLGWPESIPVSLLYAGRAIFVGDVAVLLGDNDLFPVGIVDLRWLGRNPPNRPLPFWLGSVVAGAMASRLQR